jgi:hypothetical protein
MGLFKKRQDDDVAWYRHRNYKGSLSEDQKMELDSIRWQSKSERHPAAKFEDLPDEVQSYIISMKSEAMESRYTAPGIASLIGIVSVSYCIIAKIGIIKYSILLPPILHLFSISAIFSFFSIFHFVNVHKAEVDHNIDRELLKNWEIEYLFRKNR